MIVRRLRLLQAGTKFLLKPSTQLLKQSSVRCFSQQNKKEEEQEEEKKQEEEE